MIASFQGSRANWLLTALGSAKRDIHFVVLDQYFADEPLPQDLVQFVNHV
jgi:hypothetical protein